MAKRYCHVCEFRGVKTVATTGYVCGFSGERTHTCEACLSDHQAFARHMSSEAPYQRDSESSRDGARRAASKAAGQAEQVLSLIVAAGAAGLIEEEITCRTGLPRNESTRAINQLHSPREGEALARKADFRRPARSGVHVQVYVATEAGRNHIHKQRSAV